MIVVEPVWLLLLAAVAGLWGFVGARVARGRAFGFGIALGAAVTFGYMLGSGRPPFDYVPRAPTHERACTTILVEYAGAWQVVCK